MFAMTPYQRMNDLDPFRTMLARDRFGFRIDIEDEGTALLLSADLPGFEKEDIHIDLENDRLTIRAERRCEKEDKTYLRCERSYGSYSRSFNLVGVDAENISASYRNGVLRLTLPKLNPTKPEPKHIEIQ